MNLTFVSTPDSPAGESVITLEKELSAIEIVKTETSPHCTGGFANLPQGSRLEICGVGFNHRTCKVRCQGRLFFVFQQDIQLCANKMPSRVS